MGEFCPLPHRLHQSRKILGTGAATGSLPAGCTFSSAAFAGGVTLAALIGLSAAFNTAVTSTNGFWSSYEVDGRTPLLFAGGRTHRSQARIRFSRLLRRPGPISPISISVIAYKIKSQPLTEMDTGLTGPKASSPRVGCRPRVGRPRIRPRVGRPRIFSAPQCARGAHAHGHARGPSVATRVREVRPQGLLPRARSDPDLVCIAESQISAVGPDMVINVYAGIHEM